MFMMYFRKDIKAGISRSSIIFSKNSKGLNFLIQAFTVFIPAQ